MTGNRLNAGTVYTNESDFPFTQKSHIETFESASLSGTLDSGAVSHMSFASFDLFTSPAALKILNSAAFGAHNTTSGGSRYLYLDTDLGGEGTILNYTFSVPVYGFSLHLTDIDVDNTVIEIPGLIVYQVPAGTDGNDCFWGFTSSIPFTQAQINTQSDSSVGIDDVSVVIPEPGLSWFVPFAFALLHRRS